MLARFLISHSHRYTTQSSSIASYRINPARIAGRTTLLASAKPARKSALGLLLLLQTRFISKKIQTMTTLSAVHVPQQRSYQTYQQPHSPPSSPPSTHSQSSSPPRRCSPAARHRPSVSYPWPEQRSGQARGLRRQHRRRLLSCIRCLWKRRRP